MEKVSGVGTLTRPSRDPISSGVGGGGNYNYETYHFSNSTSRSSNTSKIQSTPPPIETNPSCCSFQCCKRFTRSFCSNVGVCLLLLAYTLLGSFIFLAIEGGGSGGTNGDVQIDPTEKSITALTPQQNQNVTAWLRRANTASRARAVENIWDITVSLNILYRENWTRLAAEELARFQDEVIRRVVASGTLGDGTSSSPDLRSRQDAEDREWTFAKSFLYSLTLLTTIGHGGMAPRTSLGKIVTILYALLGIPLMLLYLSSIGSALSLGLRRVLAGKCPCQDPKPEVTENNSDPPFYLYNNVSSNKYSTNSSNKSNNNNSKKSMIAPILTCIILVIIYIGGGAAMLLKWDYSFLDGLFFCFMSLSTIGFGDVINSNTNNNKNSSVIKNQSTWFCAIYILIGMALTATCFNVIHDEINNKLKKSKNKNKLSKNKPDVTNNEDTVLPPPSQPPSITVIPTVQQQTVSPQSNNGTFS